jgi:DNA-binding NtrC family response regulator
MASVGSDDPQGKGCGPVSQVVSDAHRALLIAANADIRQRLLTLLASAKCDVVEAVSAAAVQDSPPEAGLDLIVIGLAEGEPPPAARMHELSEGEYPPPIVVFGSGGAKGWQRVSMENGAFACLSLSAPTEEQSAVLSAALRYRAAQKENQLLRDESNRILTDVLQSFGTAQDRLKRQHQHSEGVRKTLAELQARIVRAFS